MGSGAETKDLISENQKGCISVELFAQVQRINEERPPRKKLELCPPGRRRKEDHEIRGGSNNWSEIKGN